MSSTQYSYLEYHKALCEYASYEYYGDDMDEFDDLTSEAQEKYVLNMFQGIYLPYWYTARIGGKWTDHISPSQTISFLYACDSTKRFTHPHRQTCDKYSVFCRIFDMYTLYTNMNPHTLNSILNAIDLLVSVAQTCMCLHWHEKISETTLDYIHAIWCNRSKVSILHILDGLNIILPMVNNDFMSPLCYVWMERYDAVDECMTTWLPKEMMEDVAWLLGEETQYSPLSPNTPEWQSEWRNARLH